MARAKKTPVAEPIAEPIVEAVAEPVSDGLVSVRVIVPSVRLGGMRVAYDGEVIRVTDEARASMIFARQVVDHG